jgi:excinuclease ABC subunit C
MAAIAKREEELFVPGRDEPIRLERSSPVLHLVQRVRDEAHRFAVSFHRKLRSRRTVTTSLRAIPGVGEATARKLLRAFGSVAGVTAAGGQELAAVVGERLAGRIRSHLEASTAATAAPPGGSEEGAGRADPLPPRGLHGSDGGPSRRE